MRLCGRIHSKFTAICAFLQREGNGTISHSRCTELLVSSYTNNHGNPFLGPTVGVPHTVNLRIHERSEAKIKRERERGKENRRYQLETYSNLNI